MKHYSVTLSKGYQTFSSNNNGLHTRYKSLLGRIFPFIFLVQEYYCHSLKNNSLHFIKGDKFVKPLLLYNYTFHKEQSMESIYEKALPKKQG